MDGDKALSWATPWFRHVVFDESTKNRPVLAENQSDKRQPDAADHGADDAEEDDTIRLGARSQAARFILIIPPPCGHGKAEDGLVLYLDPGRD